MRILHICTGDAVDLSKNTYPKKSLSGRLGLANFSLFMGCDPDGELIILGIA
jgi:hypothetical protein